MKVVSTDALTKLIQLIKNTFIKVDDVVQIQEITLATVATTGDYDDLSNKPTIPTVNNAALIITQNNTSVGTFTANASSDVTLNLSDTTYSTFTGATSSVVGSSGLVPAPTTSDIDSFLKGDGTWSIPSTTILVEDYTN